MAATTGFLWRRIGRWRPLIGALMADSSGNSRRYYAMATRLKPRSTTVGLPLTSRASLHFARNCIGLRSRTCNYANLRQFSADRSNYNIQTEEKEDVDPFGLVQNDLNLLCCNIKQELGTDIGQLLAVSGYHFDGAGKSFRPMVVMLVAKACNIHANCALKNNVRMTASQMVIAMVAEMVHTASLIHDDVIDKADMRRGKPTVQKLWGQKRAVLAGNYILSMASVALAKIRNEEVVTVVTQYLEDLIEGEFMQLGSKEHENERFNHYLKKTYKKTASLIANSCKAVAMLSQCAEDIVEIASEYGKHVGIAFQLVDDLLDFISTEAIMGKPASTDLKLGLATAPVLYAAHQYPEINPMIMRRFSQPGDIQQTLELVAKSDGVSHTLFLAKEHCKEAVKQISQLTASKERQALINITHGVINRLK